MAAQVVFGLFFGLALVTLGRGVLLLALKRYVEDPLLAGALDDALAFQGEAIHGPVREQVSRFAGPRRPWLRCSSSK